RAGRWVTGVRVGGGPRRLLRGSAWDVVHSTGYEGAWLPRARCRVDTSHHPDLPRWDPPPWSQMLARLGYLRRLQGAALERQALKRAGGAIFVSAFAREQARERGYPTRASRVIPNGVDPGVFSPTGRDRLGPPVVLFVGRRDDQKGVDVLLKAFGLLRKGVRLRLAGTGPQEEEYRRQAAEQGLDGVVEFLGGVERRSLPALLGEAPVFGPPSRYENPPLSILQTMACEQRAVAAGVGGGGEMVDDGVEGLLVPAGDAGALAGALARLIEDPRRRARMGEAGRSRVLDRFTWQKVAAETEAFYEKLM